MFGEDDLPVSSEGGATAAESPGVWASIASAAGAAAGNLAKQFPTVATNVIAGKTAAAATAAQTKLAKAQAAQTAADAEKIKALTAQSAGVKTLKQESKWAIPLLVGGVTLLGVALWMRSRKKKQG